MYHEGDLDNKCYGERRDKDEIGDNNETSVTRGFECVSHSPAQKKKKTKHQILGIQMRY